MGLDALRPALDELLKVLCNVTNKASTFKPALTHLESTLQAIIPRLDEITRLDRQMGQQNQSDMSELIAITNRGKALVLECSNISGFNIYRKVLLSNELIELDNSIARYFSIILPLEQFKLSKKILQVKLANGERLGELHLKKNHLQVELTITKMMVIMIVGLVAAAVYFGKYTLIFYSIEIAIVIGVVIAIVDVIGIVISIMYVIEIVIVTVTLIVNLVVILSFFLLLFYKCVEVEKRSTDKTLRIEAPTFYEHVEDTAQVLAWGGDGAIYVTSYLYCVAVVMLFICVIKGVLASLESV